MVRQRLLQLLQRRHERAVDVLDSGLGLVHVLLTSRSTPNGFADDRKALGFGGEGVEFLGDLLLFLHWWK